MANTSTPKLKVYRLNEGYSQTGDNDVQSMTNDEMLPIVKKNLNPLEAEPMVGVRARRDGRIVVGSSDWSTMAIDVVVSGGYVQTKYPVCCEGWLLGKGNLEVCVFRGKKNATGDTVNDRIDDDLTDFATYDDTGNGSAPQWMPIDRRFWDYDIESRKTYLCDTPPEVNAHPCQNVTTLPANTQLNNYDFANIGVEDGWQARLSFSVPSNGVSYEIHEMDWITFRIGKMLTSSTRFFKAGYTDYLQIATTDGNTDTSNVVGKILVRYKKYCEMGQNISSIADASSYSSALSSSYRVPFGDIYNGNVNGRCLNVIKGDNTQDKVNLVEDVGSRLDNSKQHFYEGNYLFRKRIYPLRTIVIGNDDDASSSGDFVFDHRMSNMKVSIPCESSWFMDDVMKPVVFERILIDQGTSDERKIYKQLTKRQVNVVYQKYQGNDLFVVALNSSYYSTGAGVPKELFFVYNYVDDSLGNLFDFDYDYVKDTTHNVDSYVKRSASVGYGYANDGRLATDNYDTDTTLTIAGIDGYIYLKRTMIATDSGNGGYDASRDIVLEHDTVHHTVSFTIPNDGSDFEGHDDTEITSEQREKNRINDGLQFLHIDASHPLSIYADGVKLCSFDGTITSCNNITIGERTGFIISLSDRTVSVSNSNHPEYLDDVTELMFSYYEKHEIAFSKSGVEGNEKNPYCLGYRVVCHEKTPSATLFVSSFPNWVKGHVNNDLDVFVGNKLYSGTEVQGGNLSEYHNIYPQYVKDGWYAMYQDGAIEFNDEQKETSYFDILNYSGESAGAITPEMFNTLAKEDFVNPYYWSNAQKLALALTRVKYNVAHYDGIYSVIRGVLSNYSNKGETYRYALLEDDDNIAFSNRRWVGKEGSGIRRMFEDGRDEIPKLVHGVSTNDFPLSEVQDIKISNGEVATVNTKNDRISVFFLQRDESSEGDTDAVLCFGNVPTNAELIDSNDIPEGYVKIRVKIPGINVASIQFRKEENGESSDWTIIEDNDDVVRGELNSDEDEYVGHDISEVQNGAMFYRYHNASASWAYDVYFEVLSFRGSAGVELIAYRVMKES